jgi:hypothetical protein
MARFQMSFIDRTTLWIDGERVRVLKGTSMPLANAAETASALKAVEALAPKPAKRGLHMLRVIVGAPFVRYYALPWQPLPKPEDWIPLARMQALQTGAGGEPWRYAIPDGAWGQGRLAAAMPEALCAGIEHLCKTRKLLLGGIEPAYTVAMQKHANRIRDGAIAIVQLEPNDAGSAIAHIGLRRGGGWSGFIALPVVDSLDEVLRDAFVLCGVAHPERRYVISAGGERDAARWRGQASQAEWLAAPWDTAA